MIVGIGIDAVDVSRLERWVGIPGLIERYFDLKEIEECRTKGSSFVFSLAARFAAKEAFGKALGTGLSGMSLKNICLTNQISGKPLLKLMGNAYDAFVNSGGDSIHVSITHEKTIAIAVVIIEGGLHAR